MSEKIRKVSLSFKINIIILIACLMFALVCSFVLYFTGVKVLEQKYDDSNALLRVVFEQNREDIANEIFAEQEIALQESLKEILKIKGIAGVGVYDKKGTLLSSAGTEFIKKLSSQEMMTLTDNAVFLRETVHSKNIASYSSVIKVIGEQLGYIKIYYDFSKINKQLSRVMIILIILYIGTILIISLILYLSLSRFIIRPVLLLKNAMEQLDNKVLGVK
ncbi:MAG: hypothetical protein K8R67_16665, partial [Desulfobacteraceae bacterium]|nr:hypothetical protein [Desulfobacteraceae bacterium]